MYEVVVANLHRMKTHQKRNHNPLQNLLVYTADHHMATWFFLLIPTTETVGVAYKKY